MRNRLCCAFLSFMVVLWFLLLPYDISIYAHVEIDDENKENIEKVILVDNAGSEILSNISRITFISDLPTNTKKHIIRYKNNQTTSYGIVIC